MNPLRNSSTVLALLTIAVSTIALASFLKNWASALEAVCFATGAICVWLVVRENIWNFPIGLLNVSGYAIVFFQSKLYADAGLQIVYFLLGCVGWIMWSRGAQTVGERTHCKQPILRTSKLELLTISICVAIGTIALWRTLHLVGGSASFWDAITTSLSLASQWLLNRKQLENWIGWIVVDAIYVPLYIYKELYLTSLLYAVFLVMAIIGIIEWHRSWRSQCPEPATNP